MNVHSFLLCDFAKSLSIFYHISIMKSTGRLQVFAASRFLPGSIGIAVEVFRCVDLVLHGIALALRDAAVFIQVLVVIQEPELFPYRFLLLLQRRFVFLLYGSDLLLPSS